MFDTDTINDISDNNMIIIITNIINKNIRIPSIYQQDGQPFSFQPYQV